MSGGDREVDKDRDEGQMTCGDVIRTNIDGKHIYKLNKFLKCVISRCNSSALGVNLFLKSKITNECLIPFEM